MISVIIPTFSRSYLLKKALDSLVKQNFDKYQFEMIVVDNNSSDDTKDVTLQFIKDHQDFNIKYVFESIPGLVAGRHRGFQESRFDILSYVDEDIIADVNWLKSVCDAFSDPEVMIATGKILPDYETIPPAWLEWFWINNGREKHCGWLSLLDMGNEKIDIDPTMVWGVNYSIRKKALIDLGGFNPDTITEEYFYYGGDGETGLSLKAIDKKYKVIYHPEMLINHFVPTSRMTYDYFRKRARIQGKCTSYTEIRKYGKVVDNVEQNKIPNSIRVVLGKIKRLDFKTLFSKSTTKILTEEELLKKDFHEYYLEGYQTQKKLAKKNPQLLQWILKENYFDYSLPEKMDLIN